MTSNRIAILAAGGLTLVAIVSMQNAPAFLASGAGALVLAVYGLRYELGLMRSGRD